ncbi:hypothetical protein EVAR_6897_1 [Eumeta japonica]|uniref:Uncharacterized protein n=1 Tax=Eumeta variegata TaxID=151549 RepID=A0A4C1TJC4_EUMVA|nr:hypothetical protein EVAR_6897_1 [Eumeta japonica]
MWCCFCRLDEESEIDVNVANGDDREQCRSAGVNRAETSNTSNLDVSKNGLVQDQVENTTPMLENAHSDGVYENQKTVIGDSSWLDEQYATSVDPRNYYGADFRRWLKNDVIYVIKNFDPYKNDISKTIETAVADYNNAYQEFELFASWKKKAAPNQTSIRDSYGSSFVNSGLSYASILRSDLNAQQLSNIKSISCSQIVTKPAAEYSSGIITETDINNRPRYAGNPVARVVPRFKQTPSDTTFAVTPKQNQSYPLHRNVKDYNRYLNKVEIIKCTDNGYIINKEVHLLTKNWHAVLDSDNVSYCLLCGVMYYDRHIYEQNHLSRLQWSVSKILNKGSNIVREAK